jgi:hypothetical protein
VHLEAETVILRKPPAHVVVGVRHPRLQTIKLRPETRQPQVPSMWSSDRFSSINSTTC